VKYDIQDAIAEFRELAKDLEGTPYGKNCEKIAEWLKSSKMNSMSKAGHIRAREGLLFSLAASMCLAPIVHIVNEQLIGYTKENKYENDDCEITITYEIAQKIIQSSNAAYRSLSDGDEIKMNMPSFLGEGKYIKSGDELETIIYASEIVKHFFHEVLWYEPWEPGDDEHTVRLTARMAPWCYGEWDWERREEIDWDCEWAKGGRHAS
jgi:hypothetical protein